MGSDSERPLVDDRAGFHRVEGYRNRSSAPEGAQPLNSYRRRRSSAWQSSGLLNRGSGVRVPAPAPKSIFLSLGTVDDANGIAKRIARP